MERSWRRATFIIGTFLLAALIWGGWQFARRTEAETLHVAQQQRALFELIVQVEQAQVMLAKSNVATSAGQQVIHLTDVWRQAFGAQSNLNQLPLQANTLMRTSQLLTQTGDYAYMLARRAARGDELTAEERALMRDLQQQLGIVAEQLHSVVAAAAADGAVTWREMRSLTNKRLADSPNSFRDGFDSIDVQLVEFPTLIYDGPFSDHILQQTPKGLTGTAVDKQEAGDIALRFAPVDADSATVNVRGEVEGRVPAWQTRVVRNKGVIDIDVSRQGGHVIWMLDSRAVGPRQIHASEAVDRALEFLEERGRPDMVPTWMTVTEDRVVIPFAYVEDDVVIYPDLIKVTVALDDGSVIGYEALGFLMSHHERDLPKPLLTEAEARQIVHDDLTVEDGRLALIPLDTLAEVLTWEFSAHADDDPYIVYVNALTGEEEQILKLLDTNEGTLVL